MKRLHIYTMVWVVFASACSKDLPRFPDLSTELKPIGIDSLQVKTSVSGRQEKARVKEAGILWGYNEFQLTLKDTGANRLPTPDPGVDAFTTLLANLPFDTLVYVRSYALIESDGEFPVYGRIGTHTTGQIQLRSTYKIANNQVTAVTNVSNRIQSLRYVWINLDSIPDASLSSPHDSLPLGAIAEKGTYTQLLSRLKSATTYLLRAQGTYQGRAIYGNTMAVFVGDVWQQVNNFALAGNRWATVAFTIDNQGFVGLGEKLSDTQDPYAGSSMKDLWLYDQTRDKWSKMKDFPGSGRFRASAFVIDGKAYVGAGRNSAQNQHFKDFYRYNPPPVNRWDTVTALSFLVRSATGFSINGKGYLCGGFSPNYNGLVRTLNTLYEFDPSSNNGKGAWRQLASLPGPGRKNPVSFVLNGKAYVGCGKDGTGSDENINDGQVYNDFYCFDPQVGSLGTWTKIEPLPGGGRYDALAFSIGGYGYVGTGASSPYATYKDLWRYKPGEGWERQANVGPFNRNSSFAFVSDNKAFIGLGFLTAEISIMDNDVWRYTPEKK